MTPTPVDPAAASGPVDRVAECEALRAEVERLRVQVAAVEALLPGTAAEYPIFPSQLRQALGAVSGEYLLLRRADIAAALASPPEPEADERPTPLSAEIREIAEMWLYDGDTDQPINDGYFRALDLANRLESPKGAS